MGAAPKITRIVVIHYTHEIQNLTLEDMYGFDMVYKEGSRLGGGGSILIVETDAGVRAEIPGGIDDRTAQLFAWTQSAGTRDHLARPQAPLSRFHVHTPRRS